MMKRQPIESAAAFLLRVLPSAKTPLQPADSWGESLIRKRRHFLPARHILGSLAAGEEKACDRCVGDCFCGGHTAAFRNRTILRRTDTSWPCFAGCVGRNRICRTQYPSGICIFASHFVAAMCFAGDFSCCRWLFTA